MIYWWIFKWTYIHGFSEKYNNDSTEDIYMSTCSLMMIIRMSNYGLMMDIQMSTNSLIMNIRMSRNIFTMNKPNK